MKNSFVIPVELTDLNTYISAERSNRHIAASLKKKNTEIVAQYCQDLELKKTAQYDVSIEWHTKDKRKDSDNVFFAGKFIFDGVVLAGKLSNDGYKHIRNIHNCRFIGNQKIVVSFSEVE